jgi:putative glycosyltransferase (TIGR04372 family)
MIGARVKRLIRLAIATPLACTLVALSRALAPVFVVRFGSMRSDRVGHFALETDLALAEQEVGISPVPKRGLDIWYAAHPISNSAMARLWGRVVRVWPAWFMAPTYRVNVLIPGGARHTIPSSTRTVLDVHNLLDRVPPRIALTEREMARGRAALNELGVPGDTPVVPLILRDAAFTMAAFPGKDMSYHDYRNCDIDDLKSSALHLAQQGYAVLRMGAVVEKPFEVNHPRVIDYASSGLRTEFLDVYVAAVCEFCISDGLGYASLPAIFRRQNVFVNFTPFHAFYSSRSSDIGIPKWIGDARTGKPLPLSEIIARDAVHLTSSAGYAERGVVPLANDPADALEVVREVVARRHGAWVAAPEDDELQTAFWCRYAAALGPTRDQLHGEFRARIGADFLRRHRGLWDA